MSDPDGHDEPAAEETPQVHGCPRTESRGQTVLHPTREGYRDLVKTLADDGYTVCVDLTAVDFVAHPGRPLPPGVEPERFEVAAMLLDLDSGRRIRVRVQVPADDPTLPSLFDVHPGTEAMEREVYDMFGITFGDHPDLTRILMPEDWDGHPLRKDYAVGAVPVQFKAAPS